MTCQCDYCLRYSPTFHQIASQEQIVQRMSIGRNVITVLKELAKSLRCVQSVQAVNMKTNAFVMMDMYEIKVGFFVK